MDDDGGELLPLADTVCWTLLLLADTQTPTVTVLSRKSCISADDGGFIATTTITDEDDDDGAHSFGSLGLGRRCFQLQLNGKNTQPNSSQQMVASAARQLAFMTSLGSPKSTKGTTAAAVVVVADANNGHWQINRLPSGDVLVAVVQGYEEQENQLKQIKDVHLHL